MSSVSGWVGGYINRWLGKIELFVHNKGPFTTLEDTFCGWVTATNIVTCPQWGCWWVRSAFPALEARERRLRGFD